MFKDLRLSLLLCSALLLTAVSTFAADIDQVDNQTGTENWNNPGAWSNGAAPSAGNDYFSTNLDLRTPTSGTPGNFAGDSLTINSGSRFIAKHGFNSNAAGINLLVLNGGQLFAGSSTGGGDQQRFEGDLTIAADSVVTMDGSGRRRLRYRNGTLSGAGSLTFNGAGGTDRINDIFVFQDMSPVGHTGALIAENIRFITVGPDNDNIGDTAPVVLQNAWYDMQNDETFGGLAGDAGSQWRLNAGRTPTLSPTSDQVFAGTLSRSLSNLTIDGTATQTFDGVTLQTDNSIIVENGTLALTGNGTTTAGFRVEIGKSSGSDGTLRLDGGTLNVLNNQLETGRGGTGAFIVNGGTANLDTSFIGVDDLGTMTINGGAVNVNSEASDDLHVGFRSEGIVTVDGGDLTVGRNVILAQNGNGTGTLTLSSGTVDIGNRLTVGNVGDGILNVSGGTLTVPEYIRLSESSGSTGIINQSGGVVDVGAGIVTSRNGNTDGQYNLSGGELNVTDRLWVGFDNPGAFTQTGGTAIVTHVSMTSTGGGFTSGQGTLTLNGGVFQTNEILEGNGSNSEIRMGGGTLRAGDSFSTPVPITITPGSSTLDTNGNDVTFTDNHFTVDAGTFTKTGTGAMTIPNERQLRIGFGGGSDGTFVLEEGSLNVLTQQTELGRGGSGTLTINGGTANLERLFIAVDDTGVLNVNDGNLNIVPESGGSANTGNLYVGFRGDGTANFTGGASNIASELRVAEGGASTGELNVANNAALNVGGPAYIGFDGDATANFTGGTVAITGDFRIAENPSSSAVVTHDAGDVSANRFVLARRGPATYDMNGGTLTSTNDSWIALAGNGEFTQTGGDVVIGGNLNLTHGSESSGRTGTLNLNGGTFTTGGLVAGNGADIITMSGGTLRAGRNFSTVIPLTIESGGGTLDTNGNDVSFTSGDFVVENDGTFTKTGAGNMTVTNGSLRIGNSPGGGNGTFVLEEGTLNVPSGQTETGRNGDGTLTIAGGTANLRNAFIGVDESAPYDATGTLNVSAGNLNFTQALNVGYRGNGIVNVTGGTTVVGGDLRLSESASNIPSTGTVNHSAGSVTVNRYVGARQPNSNANYYLSGGDLDAGSTMWVGFDGPGTFTQTGGTASAGEVLLTQPTTTNGQGTLNLNGGVFTADTLSSGGGASAILNVGGGNATILGDLRLGQAANGTAALNVSDGVLTVNGNAYVGDTRDATAHFTGGTIDVTGDFRLAENSTSSVLVTHDAGDVSAARFVPARNGPTTYDMNGGTLTTTGDGWAALGGNGTFTQTGGDAAFGGDFYLTHVSGGISGGRTGTLNLNGGTFTVNSLVKGSGTTDFNMNGGTLRAGTTFTSPSNIGITLNAPNGGTFDSNGNTLTIAGDLSGAGGVTKTGAGTVVLTGSNSFTGPIAVNQDTLRINSAGAFGSPSSVNIAGGATFDTSPVASFNPGTTTFSGIGTLQTADFTWDSGTAFAPGNSPGTMVINPSGTFDWTGGSYDWELADYTGIEGSGLAAAGTGWDYLDVNGTVALNGGVINVILDAPVDPDIHFFPGKITTFNILESDNVLSLDPNDFSILAPGLDFAGDFTLALIDSNTLGLTFTSTIPEPSTYALLGLMLAGVFVYRKRRQKQN